MTTTPVRFLDPSSSLAERFGPYGGRYVPETLVPACEELESAFREAWADAVFRAELDAILRDYAGRPSIHARQRQQRALCAGTACCRSTAARPPS